MSHHINQKIIGAQNRICQVQLLPIMGLGGMLLYTSYVGNALTEALSVGVFESIGLILSVG